MNTLIVAGAIALVAVVGFIFLLIEIGKKQNTIPRCLNSKDSSVS